VQDPRQRPSERAAAADEAQKRFDDEKSDFLSWIKLWNFFEEALAHRKSSRKLHEACREHFLSFNRMQEWRDIHGQLKELVVELGWRISETPATYQQVHRALLAGLLGNVGTKTEEGNYLGARGIRFWVHPGSGVGRKAGRWVMAAELTETTRLYARCVATVETEWLESVGAHLVKRHQYEPHWEKQPARVAAFERGTLYGLLLYAKRRMHYGPMNPVESRKIFIRQALVEGDYETRAPFFAHNRRLVREIEQLEHKSRRPDVLVDDELICAFYEGLVPEGIHNGADFDRWRREAESANPKLLFLKREDLMRHEAAGITTVQFPHRLEMAGRSFALDYHHEPGSPRDGVTLTVPLLAPRAEPRRSARCLPAGDAPCAPVDEFPHRRRARAAARDGTQPRPAARRARPEGRRAVRRACALGCAGGKNHRLGFRGSRGGDGSPARIPDAHRISGSGRPRRFRQPRGLRFLGEGPRSASHGAAPAVQAAVEGAGSPHREESTRVAGYGASVRRFRRGRRSEGAAACRGFRSCLHAGALAALAVRGRAAAR